MRKDIMLAHPVNLDKVDRWPRPFFVQPKIDGLRCRIIRDYNETRLLSSEGNEINSLPPLRYYADELPDGEYDGELYNPYFTFEKICSIVKRKEPSAGHELIQFHCFDLVRPDLAQTLRFSHLWAALGNVSVAAQDYLIPVTTEEALNQSHINHYLGNFLADGYEGIILRNSVGLYERKRSYNLFKLKPTRSDIYTIVEVQQLYSIHGEPREQLGALIVADDDGKQFKVGSGFTLEQREKYWDQRTTLPGCFVKVKYQNLTDRGVPRFPVVLEIQPSGQFAL